MNEMLPAVILGIFFIGIGILTIVSDNRRKNRCTDPVRSIVIDYKSRKGNRGGGRVYSPIFEYYYNGMRRTANISYYTRPKPFSQGMEVEIYVNPNKPDEIFVPQLKKTWAIALLFAIIGAIAIITPALAR